MDYTLSKKMLASFQEDENKLTVSACASLPSSWWTIHSSLKKKKETSIYLEQKDAGLI